jgi:hypothetical protein
MIYHVRLSAARYDKVDGVRVFRSYPLPPGDHWLVSCGDDLHTTSDKAKALQFATDEEALASLDVARAAESYEVEVVRTYQHSLR